MPIPRQTPDSIIELGGISRPGVYPTVDAGWTPSEGTTSSGGSTTPPGPDPGADIACAITEGPAGDSTDGAIHYSASVAERAGGIYTWTITNGYILSGQGTNRITFALGEAGGDCVIVCRIRNSVTGLLRTSTKTINVLPYPRTAIIATGMILSNGTTTGAVTMGKTISIKRVISDSVVRVRIYKTAAQRDADIGRRAGVAPEGDHGQILEVILTEDQKDVTLNPDADGENGDAPQAKTAYFSISNRLGIAVQATNTTIHFVQES